MLFEELVEQVIREVNPEGLAATIDRAARDLGFDYFAHGRSSKKDMLGRPSEIEALTVTYPQAWHARYFERAYGAIDPVVRISATTTAPFVWQSVPSLVTLDPGQITMLSEAQDVGLRNGVTVPIHHPSGAVEIVSFARTTGDALEPYVPCRLQAIGSLLTVRRAELEKQPERSAVPALSLRERECLTWAALGKSSWDIGHILNISTNTVNFHMKNAMQKLGCSNRVFAVVLALRLGLIQP